MKNKKSILWKNCFGMSVLIIAVTIAMNMALFAYQRQQSSSKADEESKNVHNTIYEAMEESTSQVDGIITSIYYELSDKPDSEIASFFDTTHPKTPREEISIKTKLDSFFANLSIIQPKLLNVYIYVNEGHQYLYSNYGGASFNYTPQAESWFTKAENSDGRRILSFGYNPGYCTSAKDVIGFSRVLKNLDPEKYKDAPVISIDFSMDLVTSSISPLLNSNLKQVMLADDSGKTVYSLGNLEETIPKQDILDSSDANKKNGGSLLINKTRLQVSSSQKRAESLNLITVTSNKDELERLKEIWFFSCIIILASIILLVTATYFFVKRLYKPMSALLHGMECLEKGEFKIIPAIESDDEFGVLTSRFNQMVLKIRELIRINFEEKIQLKEMQLNFLQSQISPHFVYNSLQVISSIAIVHGISEIEKVSDSLAKLMRYSLQIDEKEIPIEQELEIVRNYLDIQSIRFTDKVEYSIEIDDDVRCLPIIKMILQPIAENSIKYGVESTGKKTNVSVIVSKSSSFLSISIQDNGPGLSESRLKELKEMLSSNQIQTMNKSEHSNHLALSNICRRLKLYYGDSAGLEITSEINEGCQVKITIPMGGKLNAEADYC